MIKEILLLAEPIARILNMILSLIKPALVNKEAEISENNSSHEKEFETTGRPN